MVFWIFCLFSGGKLKTKYFTSHMTFKVVSDFQVTMWDSNENVSCHGFWEAKKTPFFTVWVAQVLNTPKPNYSYLCMYAQRNSTTFISGWIICVSPCTQLTKERIDHWSDEFKSAYPCGDIPAFQLKADFSDTTVPVCDLSRKLTLKGALGEDVWLQVFISQNSLTGIIL